MYNEESIGPKKKKSTRGKAELASQQDGSGSTKKRERESEVVRDDY